MRKSFVLFVLVAVFGAFALQAAFAQEADPAAAPTYAELNLAANFELDPYLLRIIGTGEIEAASVSGECSGMIPAAPSVVINWSGETDMLRLYTYTNDDPVIVVVTPGGDVLCNDDINPVTLDAAVKIENPAEGRYAVHVGTYDAEVEAHGFLVITELDYNIARTDLSPLLVRRDIDPILNAPQRPVSELNAHPEGLYGDDTLEAGFGTVEISAAAGGGVPAFNYDLGSLACTGFINIVPTYTFTLSEDGEVLRFVFNGEDDTTLIVEQPDGSFVCNDDTDGENNINPTVDIEAPAAGDYRVFVGSYTQQSGVRGTLVIADSTDIEADVLPFETEQE